MATTEVKAPTSLLPVIGPDGLLRESPAIAYTEKKIEAAQLQLRKYIEENYSKIRDVERELGNLILEMKFTAGPKKAALELMRKKVEMSMERICVAKQKKLEAKRAWEAAAHAVRKEEAIKQKLCEDLNNLVQESSNVQLSKMEELKHRLEALNPGRSSTYVPSEGNQSPAVATLTQKSPAAPSIYISEGADHIGEGNDANSSIKDQNQQPPVEAEGRGKKRSTIYGKMKLFKATLAENIFQLQNDVDLGVGLIWHLKDFNFSHIHSDPNKLLDTTNMLGDRCCIYSLV